MEKAKEEKQTICEIETEHPGYLGSQDKLYVGNMKSVGRIYQQTCIDTYSRVAFFKLYDRKNALMAADILNDKVLPFFESEKVRLGIVFKDSITFLKTKNLKLLRKLPMLPSVYSLLWKKQLKKCCQNQVI